MHERPNILRGGPRRTMSLALAASAGLHAAAVLAAGWWLHPVVWNLKPVHVISVQVLEGRGAAGTPSPARAQLESPRAPLRHKPTVAVRRSAPAEERTPAPPRKIRIAQKGQAHRASPAAPPPTPPRRVAAAQRLSPRPGTPRPPGSRTQGHALSASPPPGSPFIVAKAEPSKGWDRDARLEAIRRLIQKTLVYPQAARRFGWEGTARVRFVLAHDGQPRTVVLESSSHMAILDHEALAAVRRAAPYPFVEGAIVIPIVFDLKAPRPRMMPPER